MKVAHAFATAGLMVISCSAFVAKSHSGPAKNSWRGITPLRSNAGDVARLIGVEEPPAEASLSGPFKVEGGEVTFSYISPSLAKIFRAPRSMVGKVFTIYFQPNQEILRAELTLAPGFKRCVEERDRTFYYMVSEVGLAYRFLRASERVDAIIYQPSRAEVRSLAVNTECVF